MAEATHTGQGQGVTRREFLNYVWGAAFTLFLVQFGIGVYVFSLPRFREGEFGSDFDLGQLDEIMPPPDGAPVPFTTAKTWLVNVGPKQAAEGLGKQGLLAIYKVCTHLGCLYKYEPGRERFECPCHGSKFHLDGTKIEGPAPRGLDRFVIQLRDQQNQVVSETVVDPPQGGPAIGGISSGIPLEVPAATAGLRVVVVTGERIQGPTPDQAAAAQGG